MKDIRRTTWRHISAEDKIRIVLEGLRGEDSIAKLLFDRLYVLRAVDPRRGDLASFDQPGSVRDGAAVMSWLLPIFIDIMIDHPGREWGMPYYSVVE